MSRTSTLLDHTRTMGIAALAVSAFAISSLTLSGNAEAGTLEKIAADGRITVANVEDLAPFSFTGDDGIPSGLSIELCRAIVSELATQIEVPIISIDYVPVTVQSRLDTVVSGRADMECGATTVTLGRRERVDFSVPFFASGASVAVADIQSLPDIEALAGKRVAVIEGSTTQVAIKRALRAQRIDVEVIAVERTVDAVAAIKEDKADAIAHDKMILVDLMQDPLGADLVALPGLLSFEPYGIILPRGDADFRLAVDRAIIGLYQDGVLDDLYEKWLAPLGARPGVTLERMLQLQAVPE
ncbi:amino acid ABC transporter substrate-binding protein [Pyruvatibacter sp. HU-CL02332]|uniref:amino acid ABC transporter substrate-binding protein n=1 Tax=Pyruvatibacter sp. HU-CL02332 TaxID=3127650 RepID=UPI002967C29E|nr:amino acid ABC transporter substrate-binding protein [Alphaproteobacteria bacterium]